MMNTMRDTLHLPPDWCHATCDVASASEFPVAGAIAQERDDVEAVFLLNISHASAMTPDTWLN